MGAPAVPLHEHRDTLAGGHQRAEVGRAGRSQLGDFRVGGRSEVASSQGLCPMVLAVQVDQQPPRLHRSWAGKDGLSVVGNHPRPSRKAGSCESGTSKPSP